MDVVYENGQDFGGGEGKIRNVVGELRMMFACLPEPTTLNPTASQGGIATWGNESYSFTVEVTVSGTKYFTAMKNGMVITNSSESYRWMPGQGTPSMVGDAIRDICTSLYGKREPIGGRA